MPKQIEIDSSQYVVVGKQGADLSDWNAVIAEEKEYHTSLWRPALLSFAIVFLGVGGFIAWAMFTNLVQASTAAAKIIVESNTKTVTHSQGGTLESLSVVEGQRVLAGDTLATIDATQARSTVVQLKQQLYVLDIRLARLAAERDERPTFEVDDNLPSEVDKASAKEWLATEQKLFTERRKQFSTLIASDKLLIEQLKSEHQSLVARRQSWLEQAEVLKSDYDAQVSLRTKKLTTKTRLNEVKLQFIDMTTRVSESDSSIATNKQRTAQAELAVVNSRNEYFRLISEQIQTAQADRARAQQEIVSAEHVVRQSIIRSPQEGTIANIKVRTPGSALLPGQPLLDIVPANQAMVLEGNARAVDIDTIHVGEKVEVHLSAFSAADDRPLGGRVTYVAPDAIVNVATGEATYVFRAVIDPEEIAKRPGLFLYPGMTANVNIINGTRTAMAYLIEPITKSFSQAFHEQ